MANLANLFFGKNVKVVLLAALVSATLATLGHFVQRIVVIGSKKKMIWTNTRRIVALVENHQPIWYWTEVKLPRQSVRADVPMYPFTPGWERELSVPISAGTLHGSRPLPTSV